MTRFAALLAVARRVVAGNYDTADAVAAIEDTAPGVTPQEVLAALHMAAAERRLKYFHQETQVAA